MSQLFVLVLLVLASALSSEAMAAKIAVLGTANQVGTITNEPKPVDPNTRSYTSNYGFGGGVLVDLPMLAIFDLEIGALYYQRKPQIKAGSATLDSETTYTFKVVEAPILVRAWFLDFLSLGAGIYYSRYLGGVKYDTRIFPKNSTTVSVSSSGNASSIQKYDGGLVASLALDIPLAPQSALVLDGRYQYGLVN